MPSSVGGTDIFEDGLPVVYYFSNSIYFNGRWETFGGVDYKVNKYLSLNANVVNILNQSGAQGSISTADLVEEASQYRNYLMAGSFIRPFTLELGAKIVF